MRSLSLARPSVIAYAAERETYALARKAVLYAMRDGVIDEPGAEYPLVEAAKAHADLESGHTTGSVVLVP